MQEEITQESPQKPSSVPRTQVKKEMPKPVQPPMTKGKLSKSSLLNKDKSFSTESTQDESEEGIEERVTLLSKIKKNKKYLYIGGGVLTVLLVIIFIIYNQNKAKKMREIGGKAKKLLGEINVLLQKQSFSEALEKCQLYVKEFKEFNLPGLQKIETNIENLKKFVEKEKEGETKLTELINKKETASPDQYPDLLKEFERFTSRYIDINALVVKAGPGIKELKEKVNAAESERDAKIYKDIMAEIEPLCEKGDYNGAVSKLKELWEKEPNKSERLRKKYSINFLN